MIGNVSDHNVKLSLDPYEILEEPSAEIPQFYVIMIYNKILRQIYIYIYKQLCNDMHIVFYSAYTVIDVPIKIIFKSIISIFVCFSEKIGSRRQLKPPQAAG